MDTNAAFNNAKKNLDAKTGFIDKQMGKVDKQFDKVTSALQQKGQSGCGQVLDALQGAYKGELVLNQPKIAATPAPNKQDTQTAGLGNISAYASGSVRAQQLKDMGL